MRPAEARAYVLSKIDVPAEDLSRRIENGNQTIFENDLHWARFYLAKARLISSPRRGVWALTEEGLGSSMDEAGVEELFVRVRDENRSRGPRDEGSAPAPVDTEDETESYWFAGATWNGTDQLPRFHAEGVWENATLDKFSLLVRRMKPGDRIAAKSTFVQKRALPFETGGKSVSVMRIKATGTVTANDGDGIRIHVAWDPPAAPRDWYFYTYRTTLVEAALETESARQLVEFAFRGAPQDISWFRNQPYWLDRFGVPTSNSGAIGQLEAEPEGLDDPVEGPEYTIDDIRKEGCFLPRDQLTLTLDRLRTKKNLILQGPPGTGKTWLARRLGFVLAGSNDRETVTSRLRVVQFHPSLSYEDFVRGWRPAGDGRLELIDGTLMQAIDSARSEPDKPFILVIEEINRGNPAQIFGEMLTLLEDSKRRPSDAMELAYRRPGERVWIPDNLYVIGTMNVADRSLAIVDLALRRRFAFVDLEPQLGTEWREWCLDRGIGASLLDEIQSRITRLNVSIGQAPSLGPQFRIGHSYVTPESHQADGVAWFRDKVETEIGPLLEEYWYDSPDRAREERANLLTGLIE